MPTCKIQHIHYWICCNFCYIIVAIPLTYPIRCILRDYSRHLLNAHIYNTQVIYVCVYGTLFVLRVRFLKLWVLGGADNRARKGETGTSGWRQEQHHLEHSRCDCRSITLSCRSDIIVNKAGQRDGHLADQMRLVGIIGYNDALIVSGNGIDNLIAATRHGFLLLSLILDMRREDLLCYL